ncbi:MAG: amino acid adenylation domain-containing protein [Candidatus Aminicenantes bacterium]|jgi:amino acid adenylation domain-containing protein
MISEKDELANRIVNLSPGKLKALLQHIRDKKERTVSPLAIRPQKRDSDSFPLSFAQQRIWFLDRLEPGNPSYNLSAGFLLKGTLNAAHLEQSLTEILQRHDVLRTTFSSQDGLPVQVISPSASLSIPRINLQELPGPGPKVEALRLASQEAQRSFDLARGPLLRVMLFRLGELDHLLLMTVHHIIFDAWSMGVFIREMMVLYEAFSMGNPSPLPGLPIQYRDFVCWQRERLQGKILETPLSYWKHQLSGHQPVLELPFNRARPALQSYQGKQLSLIFPTPLFNSLKALGRQQGVTLFMTMLTAFKTLLYRYTDQDDINVGIPVAGRNQKETEELIGLFVNTLVIRTRVSHSLTFLQLLDQVCQTVSQAYAHQELPFEKLVEELQPRRDLGHTPLFQVMVVLKNTQTELPEVPGLSLDTIEVERGRAQFDLSLDIIEGKDELKASMEYNTSLFDDSMIRRMLGHFQVLLEGITTEQERRISPGTADPGTKISQLEIISQEEKKEILYDFNNTAFDYSGDKTTHELFEEQVETNPDHIAVIGALQLYGLHQRVSLEGTGELTSLPLLMSITYKELNDKSNQLAGKLQKKGIQADIIVGIMVERSVEMIVGIFAIFKAGGAYLPIDPEYPQERIDYMLKDSGAKILLAAQEIADSSGIWNSKFAISPPQAGQLAYIIYTSSTTGKPKGVMIQHRSLVNRLNWMQRKYPLDKSDTLLQKTPFTFDVSVWEIFWWAVTGAKLCLLIPAGEKDPETITNAVEKNNVTVIHFVPSMLTVFLEYLETSKADSTKKLTGLRQVIASGETLTVSTARRFNDILYRSNSTQLSNLYGPTEATIDVSYYDCQAEDSRETIPIGKPIDNTGLYVVDKSLVLQPVDVAGELCIAGAGLARGYLNRPELTAEKFVFAHSSWLIADRETMKAAVKFPMSDELSAISCIYKTGDLSRWLPDGNIEFLGRIDFQVKIRGFRIEPEEIENRLLKKPEIKNAVVLAKTNKTGDKYLCAYIVTGSDLSQQQLREHLSISLPDYMIPTHFVQVEKIPLTPNGKLDRKALPGTEITAEKQYVAPRSPEEKKLANIWSEILEVKQVGIYDHFFQLGGHSLLATRLISRIRRIFQVELPLRTVFKTPILVDLARIVKQNKTQRKVGPDTGIIPKENIDIERLLAEVETNG